MDDGRLCVGDIGVVVGDLPCVWVPLGAVEVKTADVGTIRRRVRYLVGRLANDVGLEEKAVDRDGILSGVVLEDGRQERLREEESWEP